MTLMRKGWYYERHHLLMIATANQNYRLHERLGARKQILLHIPQGIITAKVFVCRHG
ncbi:hypothetical protein PAXRUDRAFT_830030 [Paxillus rubicundulus Ve08.2h10]|uniref:Uncharacterized protein n=1 Tax=Paxillus rubicundulus Ve08.2h10 TaxID=930991 RepID=A0A0D0DLT2_9AGAM|nr:hypothetical protein PAXRUDRAFT_830030 [Paxillus rubicundulus Ve08.2h10]